MSKYKIKKIGVVILIIIAVTAILLFGYLNTYYKASSEVDEKIAQAEYSGEIDILVDGDYTIFIPVSNIKDEGIIFYPGGKVDAKAYSGLMIELAREGYISVLVDMPYNLALFGKSRAQDIIKSEPNINWYIGGHSLGGVVASSFAATSSEIKGLILLASYPSVDLRNTDLDVISIWGSEDLVLSMEKFEEAKKLLPSETTYVEIEGANHSGFGDYGLQEGDGKSNILNAGQQILTTIEIKKFLDR